MGISISKLRKQQEAEKVEMQERLNVLEKMVNYHLDNAKTEMLAGERNDQEIHTGTVVEFIKQVNITMSKEESPDLDDAVQEFFGGNILNGFHKFVSLSVRCVLGNASMGEHEGNNMFILWEDNALLRVDAYYYRWNFSSNEIIKDVEGASGVVCIKRVIDLVNTDPQVLTWAISKQASVENSSESAPKLIDDAIGIIKKVTELQLAVHQLQIEENKQGVGKNTIISK